MMRRALRWLAELMVQGPHREFVLGDLDDDYERLRESKGSIVATVWFLAMLLRSAYTLRRRPIPERRSHRQGLAAFFDSLATDIRLGARLVRKHPGISLTTTAVMTLGIGVATLAFGVYYETVRGLPVQYPDRMVAVTSTIPEEGDTFAGVSIDDYADFRAAQTTMDDMALWDAYETLNFSTGDAPPERVTVTFATSSLHGLLELAPLHGRLFTEADDLESAPRVAVLAEDF